MKKPVRVVILEDQPIIGASLRTIIDEDQELAFVAWYSSTEEALEDRLDEKDIDVFLVDLGLPGLDGVNFIVLAKKLCPQAHFMVHTISESGDKLWSALGAGATGYVLKGCSSRELTEGLKVVARGNTLLSPRMAVKLIRFFDAMSVPANPLTKREMDILQGLKSGNSYEEIATERFLSPHTVHTHIKNIYRKLHVNNREDAVKKAVAISLLGAGA